MQAKKASTEATRENSQSKARQFTTKQKKNSPKTKQSTSQNRNNKQKQQNRGTGRNREKKAKTKGRKAKLKCRSFTCRQSGTVVDFTCCPVVPSSTVSYSPVVSSSTPSFLVIGVVVQLPLYRLREGRSFEKDSQMRDFELKV
ncbi:hypothetical protein QYF36_001253 [Acer negundo]|nr:hypothetical protein QYF36_001253 [Acer negundo]